jgi:hypothetical protein
VSLTIDKTRVGLQRGVPFEFGPHHHLRAAGFDSGELVWDTANCVATLKTRPFYPGLLQRNQIFCDCVLEAGSPNMAHWSSPGDYAGV